MLTCDVGGQPDSVAASPDGRFLAVAVENERDEEHDDGVIPQLPAGHLAIFDLDGDGRPTNCDAVRLVDLTGIAGIAPDDPEPEFVDVNDDNVVVVTLQENNHIALVDLATGEVTGHFPAGSVDLAAIDVEDDGVVAGTGSLAGVLREPDAVVWLDNERLVTANEGDYEGGSRGFTIFSAAGEVLYEFGQPDRASRHGARPLSGRSRRQQGGGAGRRRIRCLWRDAPVLRRRRARQLRRRVRGPAGRRADLRAAPAERGRARGPAGDPAARPVRGVERGRQRGGRSARHDRCLRPHGRHAALSDRDLGDRSRYRRADRLGRALGPRRRSRRPEPALCGERQHLLGLAHLHDRRLADARADHRLCRPRQGRRARRL